jgi:hypothetical protein
LNQVKFLITDEIRQVCYIWNHLVRCNIELNWSGLYIIIFIITWAELRFCLACKFHIQRYTLLIVNGFKRSQCLPKQNISLQSLLATELVLSSVWFLVMSNIIHIFCCWFVRIKFEMWLSQINKDFCSGCKAVWVPWEILFDEVDGLDF